MRAASSCLFLAVFLASACTKDDPGSTPPAGDAATRQGPGVRAADFDRSCSAASDCIVVSEGTDCCLPCPSVAIAKKSAAAYQEKLGVHRSACGAVDCPAIGCVAPQATCAAGTCAVCQGAACGDGGVEEDAGRPPDGKLVEIGGPSGTFEPASVDIKVGDTITWSFLEDGHSVESGGGGGADCASDGKFASGPKTAGGVYSFTFDAPGDYAYHCVEHCAEPEGGVIHVK